MKQVKIKLLPGGIMPTKGTKGAAAWDCYAAEDVAVSAEPVLIGLGFAIEIPEGYHAKIFPRSSIGYKTNLRQPNCCGIIDSDYRGEVKAMYESRIEERVVTHSDAVLVGVHKCVGTSTVIKAGDRIAQMLIEKNEDFELVEADELSDTERGTGGFGSTGK